MSGSKVQCNQVKRGSAKGEITKCFVAPLIQLKTFPRAIIPTYAVHARPSTCNTITTQSLISEMISYHFIFLSFQCKNKEKSTTQTVHFNCTIKILQISIPIMESRRLHLISVASHVLSSAAVQVYVL